MVGEDKATEIARKRYDRRACFYDLMETGLERLRIRKWRELLWSKVDRGEEEVPPSLSDRQLCLTCCPSQGG